MGNFLEGGEKMSRRKRAARSRFAAARGRMNRRRRVARSHFVVARGRTRLRMRLVSRSLRRRSPRRRREVEEGSFEGESWGNLLRRRVVEEEGIRWDFHRRGGDCGGCCDGCGGHGGIPFFVLVFSFSWVDDLNVLRDRKSVV